MSWQVLETTKSMSRCDAGATPWPWDVERWTYINHAQGELRDRFQFINGWQAMSVVTAHRAANVGTPETPWVLVMHLPERQHWILASTANCQPATIKLYDSAPTHPTTISTSSGAIMSNDCGIYATATAMAICLGIEFDAPSIRNDIITCFVKGELC